MLKYRRNILLAATALCIATLVAILVSRNKPIVPFTETQHFIHPHYDFINLNANTIVFPTALLQRTIETLIADTKRGDGALSILHIGDSHIQADIQTSRTRELLSRWLNDTNTTRGFTFPYQAAQTNNPYDFIVGTTGSWHSERITLATKPANLGVSGIALTTKEPNSTISLRLRPGQGNGSFNRVSILFEENGGGGMIPYPNLPCQVTERRSGFIQYQLHAPTDSLTIHLAPQCNANCSLRLYGFDLAHTESRVTYHAAGLNGAAVSTYLLSENIAEGVSQLNPNIIILSLGTNDTYGKDINTSEFEHNLRKLIEQLQLGQPQALLILTTPGDHLLEFDRSNPSLTEANRVIARVAESMGCGLWDFHNVMGGLGSINLWAEHGLSARDRVHLSPKGYKLQGELLFQAIAQLAHEGNSPTLLSNFMSTDNH